MKNAGGEKTEMKYAANKLVIGALLLLIPLSVAYATPEEEVGKECIFTANIEKSWVSFTERPWVTGIVKNCDSQSWEYTSNELLYSMKDTVQIKIFDIDGNLVDDHIAPGPTKIPVKDGIIYSKYSFNDQVYRGGQIASHQDAAHEGSQYLQEDRYFFEMPQINSRDFVHRGVYKIELVYGEHTREIWFATLNPDIPWNLEEKKTEVCTTDYYDKLVRLENSVKSLEKALDRFEMLGHEVKFMATLDTLEKLDDEIANILKC